MERASSRLRVLALLVALMFVALSTRLWFLQVLTSSKAVEAATNNSLRHEPTDALRGLVLDRTGTPMVENQGSLEVRVTPNALGDQAEAVIVRLAGLLHVRVSTITSALADKRFYPYQAIPVSEFTDVRVAAYIAEHPEDFPGVDVNDASVRSYPFGAVAAPILGTVGLIQHLDYARLKDQGYGQNDQIGRAGVEQVYERYLHGTKGEQTQIVNANGDVIRSLPSRPAVEGDSLQLTIDATWQQIAEQELQKGMLAARLQHDSNGVSLRANAGAVVILDAKTGAVRAMASLPSFDPRWYVKGLTRDQLSYLSNDQMAPLVDRAYQLTYAPGSTFKPITGLVALHQGLLSLSNYYPCTTTYVHGTDTAHPFTNWEVYQGSISLAKALEISCDTFFEPFGSDFYTYYLNHQLSPNAQPLQRALHAAWGFGSPTGLDLPGEASGTIPDAAYAKAHPELYYKGNWEPFGDILMMIGAGNIAVTPLQLADAYAAIANGGHLCRPYLVDKVADPLGNVVLQRAPRCNKRLPYTAEQLQYIRSALATVVTSGTASCPFSGFPLAQVPVMGKTGTAERGTTKFQDTSWFASMVGPVSAPDYVVVTMVEQGGFGSQTAAPITRNIIEQISGLGVTPRSGCASPPDR